MKRFVLLTLILLTLTVQLASCKGQTEHAVVPATDSSTESLTETAPEVAVTTEEATTTAPDPDVPFTPIADDEAGKYGPLHRS